MSDGFLGKCKACTKLGVKTHRAENIEAVTEYDRNRPNRIQRNEQMAEYRKTLKGKEVQRIAQKKIRQTFPEKKIAWSLFSLAVASGKIKKEPCSVCGELKAQGHHEDYFKPLDVVWLCQVHHTERHKQINKEKRENGKRNSRTS